MLESHLQGTMLVFHHQGSMLEFHNHLLLEFQMYLQQEPYHKYLTDNCCHLQLFHLNYLRDTHYSITQGKNPKHTNIVNICNFTLPTNQKLK